MVNPPKAHALNKRARNASFVMTNWAEVLVRALNEQRSPPEIVTGRDSIFRRKSGRTPEKIYLRGIDVENMVQQLYDCAREINRFTWPVKK